MTVQIKNMVCSRCIAAVKQIFDDLEIVYSSIGLGYVEIRENSLSTATEHRLNVRLLELGFEKLDDQKSKTIEQIKSIIIQEIHHSQTPSILKYSELIVQHLHYDYAYLSSLFSSSEGITIEQYILQQKTERIKELLVYNEMNLTDIAENMGYSSIAHLSAQFKKITGMTPSQFKKNGIRSRKPIDSNLSQQKII